MSSNHSLKSHFLTDSIGESLIEIEEICKKLKPIVGRKADELYFRYRFESDPARRKRIEQIILVLYQQNIDSILSDKKVLLPPPDTKDSQGEYELGSVIYDNREIGKFGLREKEFLRHLGLFGITGTGKSNVVFKLIDELIRHMS